MICVDASVAVKWLFPEERSALAFGLLATAAQRSEPLCAPPLLRPEVTNALRKRMVREGLAIEDATRLLQRFLITPVAIHNPDGLHQRALELAAQFNLPATYDAHYLALAQHAGCDLWTDDGRLLGALNGRLPFVRWLGDFTE